jgi:hypothetical protein
MKTLVRFLLVAAFWCGTIFSAPAFAQTSAAKVKQNPARSVDVNKLFRFYDMYLRLAPQERDGFSMNYQIRSRETAGRPQLAYVLGGVRTPIDVAANGQILTMPDLNMFRSGKVEIAAGQPSGSISMDLKPVVSLSRTIPLSATQDPINDYAGAVRRAGPLGAFAPKINGLTFKGVASGEVVFADGRRIGLPQGNGGVIFRPALPAMRGAVSLSFPTIPSAVDFAQQ